MILSLGLRHCFSYNAMVDIIALMNQLLQREVIPATLYSFFKFAEPNTSTDMYHIICSACGVYLKSLQKDSLNDKITCACGSVIEKAKNASDFFMTLGMKNQMMKLMPSEGIAQALTYRFTRKKINENALEDIYDGAVYKKMSSAGMPLSNPDNISYSLNGDACNVDR